MSPGLLISVLQRGLQYSALEVHINEDGSERKCTRPFNLLQPHVCDQEQTTEEDQSRVSSAGFSSAIDAPIQSSLSTLNLALQNASIMATNAVYGGSAPSATNSSTNTSSTTTTGKQVSSSNLTPGNKKKKKETPTQTSFTKPVSEVNTLTAISDIDMESSGAVQIKTEEDSEMTPMNNESFTEEEMVELIGHQSEVIGCAWNPQKNLVASASGDSTVKLWSFPTNFTGLYEVNPRTVNRSVRTLEHVLIKDSSRSSDVTCLEWRHDGAQLATGCYDGKARIWSAQGDLQRTLQRHSGPIFAVRWNASGRFLLTGGIDGAAIIWDVDGGSVRYYLHNHTGACLDADWRTETQFVTAGNDKLIQYYDMSLAPAEGTGEPFVPSYTFIGHTDEVNTVRFDPTGRWLASCSDDTTVRLWKIDEQNQNRNCEAVKVLSDHGKEVYSLKWSPNADGTFASASFDCSVRIWRISEGSDSSDLVVTSMALTRHTQPVYAIAFSPCGKFIASGSLDETLLIWDVQSGAVLKSYSAPGNGGIFDIEWKGNFLAAGNSQGRVIVFEFIRDEEMEDGEISEDVLIKNDNEEVVVVGGVSETEAKDTRVAEDKEDNKIDIAKLMTTNTEPATSDLVDSVNNKNEETETDAAVIPSEAMSD